MAEIKYEQHTFNREDYDQLLDELSFVLNKKDPTLVCHVLLGLVVSLYKVGGANYDQAMTVFKAHLDAAGLPKPN